MPQGSPKHLGEGANVRERGSSEAGVLQNRFLVQGWPHRSKGHNGLLEMTTLQFAAFTELKPNPTPLSVQVLGIYPPPSQRYSSRVSTCLREVTIPAPNLLAVMMRQRYRGAFAVSSSGCA